MLVVLRPPTNAFIMEVVFPSSTPVPTLGIASAPPSADRLIKGKRRPGAKPAAETKTRKLHETFEMKNVKFIHSIYVTSQTQ